ncbi:DNA-binding protein [Candidatus Saganbacteria bacterium CG08_land_8_20_14_0_20_45_16]|uniref:DNA-binding protein n=1 Tax=Candidatus Saganbacteria bacterium CG08_land_8_20_14_0_20_45_16 TaxID=2014293 RepID=A0A2H0Y1X9_UNCSA|nr:MAG: DNA-binding protein [Candidatus Saganbacteria bacterium CG08_land_8_20_14_0_20_45_16]
MNDLIPVEIIEKRIYLIRGYKIMLDFDLADLYGVETKVLNQAVKRNQKRFPADFMFSLSKQEILRMSQIVTSSQVKFHSNVNAFTENGVAMLSSVLRSERAISVNIQIMRAFTSLRLILSRHKNLSEKIKKPEQKYKKHDVAIEIVFETLRKMIADEEKPKKEIGFKID